MRKLVFILGVFMVVITASSSWAFSIVDPKPGAVFKPGDKVTVRTETEPGESITAVWFTVAGMHQGVGTLSPPYEFTFTIPQDYAGADTIFAIARLMNNTAIQAKVQIQVVLPTNIVLKGISVDPTRILLQKLPPESDPNKVRAYENRGIGVGGVYSDGIEREITASANGTTYTSSNEKVATVNPEGKVTAQGLGDATITVRNGKYSATVKVVVKQYK